MRIRPCFPDLREGTSVSVLLSLSVVAVLSPDSLKGSGSVEALLWVNAKVLISGALRLQVNIRVSLSVSVKSPAGVLVGNDEAAKNRQLDLTRVPVSTDMYLDVV